MGFKLIHLVLKRTLNHLATLASLAKNVECSFTSSVIVGSNPVTVTYISDISCFEQGVP